MRSGSNNPLRKAVQRHSQSPGKTFPTLRGHWSEGEGHWSGLEGHGWSIGCPFSRWRRLRSCQEFAEGFCRRAEPKGSGPAVGIQGRRIEGRKGYAETNPELIPGARRLCTALAEDSENSLATDKS